MALNRSDKDTRTMTLLRRLADVALVYVVSPLTIATGLPVALGVTA